MLGPARDRLYKLIEYIARGPLSNERLEIQVIRLNGVMKVRANADFVGLVAGCSLRKLRQCRSRKEVVTGPIEKSRCPVGTRWWIRPPTRAFGSV